MVVTVSVWTTVTVCAGAVTVVGGAVTVVTGAVTVVAGPGTVVVTVVWGAETVVGLDGAPATVCDGVVSVRAGRVTGEVVEVLEGGCVTPSVLVPVRLPATLPAPPEPQPATPMQEPRTISASAATAPRRTRSASPHRVMPGATSRSEALVRPRPASSRRRELGESATLVLGIPGFAPCVPGPRLIRGDHSEGALIRRDPACPRIAGVTGSVGHVRALDRPRDAPGAPRRLSDHADVGEEGPVVRPARLSREEPDGGELLRVEARGPQILVAERGPFEGVVEPCDPSGEWRNRLGDSPHVLDDGTPVWLEDPRVGAFRELARRFRPDLRRAGDTSRPLRSGGDRVRPAQCASVPGRDGMRVT